MSSDRMSTAVPSTHNPSSNTSRRALPDSKGAVLLAGLLAALALVAAFWRCADALPASQWIGAAWAPLTTDTAALVFHFTTLPRLAVSALTGGALAAAGTIFQHVLRNPLASPVTLGVSSGAQLAVIAATIAAPAGFGVPLDGVALAGGLAAMGVVLAVATRHRYSSLALILSGLTVGLFLGALGHVLKLFNREYLAAIFLWNAGDLAQNDWSIASTLGPRLAILGLVIAALIQPLRLLGMNDESAKGLGVSLTTFRIATLAVAVAMASVTTAAVGTVGFVDIAAPMLAQLAGARRIGLRLILAPVIGAALLVIVDTLVQVIDQQTGAELPTGAAAAFVAAPLLLVLLPRLRATGDPADTSGFAAAARGRTGARLIAIVLALLLGGLILSCLFGRVGVAWQMRSLDLAETVLPWRWPRAVTALSAGAMLGAAGTLLQRATGNPLAGPEILGLGAATMAGLAATLLLVQSPSPALLFVGGTVGSLLLLLTLIGTGWRRRFAPDHLILTGVALTAALDAIVIAFLAANDGRASLLLGWISGSTALAEASSALALCGLATVLIPAALFFARALDLLPLGEGTARALGLAMGRNRLGILSVAALLTAGAVMAVGPLTFVGLLGPHLARRAGLRRSVLHVIGAALVGGLVMVFADWLGRVAVSPFEVPAGLVASLIGCPYLLLQLCRRV